MSTPVCLPTSIFNGPAVTVVRSFVPLLLMMSPKDSRCLVRLVWDGMRWDGAKTH